MKTKYIQFGFFSVLLCLEVNIFRLEFSQDEGNITAKVTYTGLSSFSIFRHCQKKKEDVQLESILKVYILKFEKYEQKIFLFSHVILFYKITGHDL